VGQTLAMFAVFGGILFFSAGRLDWWEAWAFLIVYFLMALGAALWMLRTNPELARERDRPGRNVKSWDNLLVGLNLLLTLALFAVIGLDAGRQVRSEVPLGVRALGLLGFIPAFGLPLWASKVNAFLSSRVRIQADRGHAVVAVGPYRYIRHPMYCSLLLLGVGAFLKNPSFPGLLILLVLGGFVYVTGRIEEAENVAKFGEEYLAYMDKTKMFIPFLV